MRRALIAVATVVALLATGARTVQTAGRSGQAWYAVDGAPRPSTRAAALEDSPSSGGPQAPQTLRARLANGPLTLRIGLARGRGYQVVTMGLEDYVAGVLAGEAAPNSPPAALEALAVTVRTFAVANLGRHRSQGFDLCDQTHCQVYRQPTAVTRRAAEATAGEVLFYDGAPASVFYSASCGGYTERPSEVWPGAVDEPYLPSKPDPACATLAGWSAALRASDLLRALHAAGFRGRRLHGIEAIARDASGRVTRLRLDGLQPDAISGQDLRVAVGGTLGWQYIKSTAFSVRRVGDGYQFDGRGSGHGVGLCVLGSVARARAGQSAADILQTYFPGTRLVNLSAAMTTAQTPAAAGPAVPTLSSPAAGSPAPAGIDVELTGDPQDRAEVQATALAARDDLARRLGVAAPAHLTIRVQPTLQAYEQATGRPWYTAGATRGDAVTLAPLATLRARGILARTIRRELVHVLTGGPLANRPLWVQDGVALFYADPRPPEAIRADADRLSGNCPRDAELRAPLSAGDLADAYARAEACVVRQIFKGKGWREIR